MNNWATVMRWAPFPELKLDPSLRAHGLFELLLSWSITQLLPSSMSASVDTKRGGWNHFQNSGFKKRFSSIQTSLCQKLRFTTCEQKKSHKYLSVLIWWANFRMRAVFRSSNKVPSLLCLPVIRSLRLSCLWPASEYPQPISICHCCPKTTPKSWKVGHQELLHTHRMWAVGEKL